MKRIDKVKFTEAPERVFKNLSQYKRIRANILLSLAKKKHKKDLKGCAFIFDRIRVSFSTKHKVTEIWLDHINGHIVLEAPKAKNESKISLENRRMQYHSQLLKHVDAMTSVGIATLYLLLNDEGRKRLDRPIKNKARK